MTTRRQALTAILLADTFATRRSKAAANATQITFDLGSMDPAAMIIVKYRKRAVTLKADEVMDILEGRP